MNRKIVSGLTLFILAIYVMNSRTHLPLNTQKPLIAHEHVLPFGSVNAGKTSPRALARSDTENDIHRVILQGDNHPRTSVQARSDANQVTSDGTDHVGNRALTRGGAEHGPDQVASNQAKLRIGGIGSDAVAMLR